MISELQENLPTLRCHHMANALEDILARSKENDLSYLDFICLLKSPPVNFKAKKVGCKTMGR